MSSNSCPVCQGLLEKRGDLIWQLQSMMRTYERSNASMSNFDYDKFWQDYGKKLALLKSLQSEMPKEIEAGEYIRYALIVRPFDQLTTWKLFPELYFSMDSAEDAFRNSPYNCGRTIWQHSVLTIKLPL